MCGMSFSSKHGRGGSDQTAGPVSALTVQRHAVRCRSQLGEANANPFLLAVLLKGDGSAGYGIGPGILFTGQVLHLELQTVQVRPRRSEA